MDESDMPVGLLSQTEEKMLSPVWKIAKLSEVAKVLYGKARPQEDGPFPVIGSGGIYGFAAEALTTGETLVIGRKGSAGTVFYAAGPCYPSDSRANA